MSISLFLCLLVFFGVIYIWIGNRASKNQNTNEDYYLMGRKLSFFPLFLTLLATQLGGGTLLGAADEAYQRGWSVLFYPLGASLGLILLGFGFGKRLRNMNISTIAELFEKVYGSKLQRRIASLLSVVALFLILVAMAIAGKKFFLGIGVSQPYIFVCAWLVLVAYTVMGGFKAVVNTDVLQVLFIAVVLVIAMFSIDTSSFQVTGQQASATIKEVPWVGWMLMPLLFMFIEQDTAQRCFAAKKTRAITMASILSGVTLMLGSSVGIYFGVLARRYGLEIDSSSSVLVESVKAFTSPLIATCFMVAIFMAILSTADSILCSISSNLSCDLLKSRKLPEKTKVAFSRVFTFSIGVATLCVSYLFDNVVTVLMISYEMSVCILLVPVLAGVFIKSPSRLGSCISMVTGAVCYFVFKANYSFILPKEVLSLVIASGGYVVGTIFSNKKAISYASKNK
ncbi:MAG: Osmoregulated proline transporter OpuE [Chlamydiia bacterium]|nr:Osmoregulated proline transporter OpuE [Chlamydiia bacterium]